MLKNGYILIISSYVCDELMCQSFYSFDEMEDLIEIALTIKSYGDRVNLRIVDTMIYTKN